jgi:hypothetical protein
VDGSRAAAQTPEQQERAMLQKLGEQFSWLPPDAGSSGQLVFAAVFLNPVIPNNNR